MVDRALKKGRRTETTAFSSLVTRQKTASDHNHLGPDLNAAVKVDDVVVAHADTARGHLRADGPGLVRAVDTVERRAEIHRARAKRIVGAADHVARQIGAAPQHL